MDSRRRNKTLSYQGELFKTLTTKGVMQYFLGGIRGQLTFSLQAVKTAGLIATVFHWQQFPHFLKSFQTNL